MPASKRLARTREAKDSTHRVGRIIMCLAFAGMNPDFLADGNTDFRFDAFNEAHANPTEFIGWPDRGGNFQRGLFNLATANCRF